MSVLETKRQYLPILEKRWYGYQVHEAEEVVLPKYILRAPEPEVIAEMEDPNR